MVRTLCPQCSMMRIGARQQHRGVSDRKTNRFIYYRPYFRASSCGVQMTYICPLKAGPPKKFDHLTRAEEVVITRLRLDHIKFTEAHILSRGPPTTCHHWGPTLTIDHMLLESAVLQERRDEYYAADSLYSLFERGHETCIIESLQEVGFLYLILMIGTSVQFLTWIILELLQLF